MDVLLHHEEEGKVSVSIYRKPTHTERYLPISSHHPLSMKNPVMSSLLRRVDYVSEDSEKEEKHVMRAKRKWLPRCLLKELAEQEKVGR